MSRRARPATLARAALVILLSPLAAYAGPPVLWHPLDIGGAVSLPWSRSSNWWKGQDGYDLRRLVPDTEILLKEGQPLIVRMETLRRAAVYASEDAAVAQTLFARILRRAAQSDDLAVFDVLFLRAVLQAIGRLGEERQFEARARNVRQIPALFDGNDAAQRIAALRPDDPEAAFACALIAASTDRNAYATYRARAVAGVQHNTLLARNIDHLH